VLSTPLVVVVQVVVPEFCKTDVRISVDVHGVVADVVLDPSTLVLEIKIVLVETDTVDEPNVEAACDEENENVEDELVIATVEDAVEVDAGSDEGGEVEGKRMVGMVEYEAKPDVIDVCETRDDKVGTDEDGKSL